MTDSPVVICGFRRSGTTAIWRSISKMERAVTYEWKILNAIPRVGNRLTRVEKERLISLLEKRVSGYESATPEVYGVPPLDTGSIVNYARNIKTTNSSGFIREIYQYIAERNGSVLYGDKNPRLSGADALAISSRWPDMKLIYVYRDGRDVAASCVFRRFYSNPDIALSKWAIHTINFNEKVVGKVKNILMIEQEDMLENPKKYHNLISSFVCSDRVSLKELERVLHLRTHDGGITENGVRIRGKGVDVAKERDSNRGRWIRDCPDINITGEAEKALSILGYKV